MKDLLKEKNADFNRPYERCLMYGPASLTDAELLAVVIRSGTAGLSAIDLAEQILHLSRTDTGLLSLLHLSIHELMEVPGIGQVKAIQLKCVGELSKRIATYSARQELSFSEPCSIADYYMEQLRHEEKESLFCMMLDTKNNMIGDERISTGTVNYAVLSTRELFLAALRYRTPSEEDILLTERVRKAGNLLNIILLDHIVIGDRCYVSFRESGILTMGE